MSFSPEDCSKEFQEFIKSAIDTLEPITPSAAVDKFIEYKESDIRPQTILEYRRKLAHFQEFCKLEEIDNLNEINGRVINGFRKYRRTESAPQAQPLARKTMRDDMYLFRDFIRFLEHIEAVSSNLSEKIPIPKIKKEDGVRNIDIDPKRVEKNPSISGTI